ncbi:hypothetical protein CSKR_103150 [Clonorchis sinensis]|uniref:Uncharacterized protein n=2 Tax=Clonorchis sinensis TaxID=79923 RepID=A0A8T1MLM0_CLOSI|nr:hypothetical protein CSKR_103150 [Clonorchis sinensis]GAA54670.1 hypothetical protein CLF_104746 [Clonorchis sinensis]
MNQWVHILTRFSGCQRHKQSKSSCGQIIPSQNNPVISRHPEFDSHGLKKLLKPTNALGTTDVSHDILCSFDIQSLSNKVPPEESVSLHSMFRLTPIRITPIPVPGKFILLHTKCGKYYFRGYLYQQIDSLVMDGSEIADNKALWSPGQSEEDRTNKIVADWIHFVQSFLSQCVTRNKTEQLYRSYDVEACGKSLIPQCPGLTIGSIGVTLVQHSPPICLDIQLRYRKGSASTEIGIIQTTDQQYAGFDRIKVETQYRCLIGRAEHANDQHPYDVCDLVHRECDIIIPNFLSVQCLPYLKGHKRAESIARPNLFANECSSPKWSTVLLNTTLRMAIHISTWWRQRFVDSRLCPREYQPEREHPFRVAVHFRRHCPSDSAIEHNGKSDINAMYREQRESHERKCMKRGLSQAEEYVHETTIW